MVVQVSLGSVAMVSWLVAPVLLMVGVALVGMVVQVRLGPSARVLFTTRHAVKEYAQDHLYRSGYCSLIGMHSMV